MGWHRHRTEIPQTLVEGLNRYAADPDYAIHGPFAYCPICQCVPTKFVVPDPPVNTADRFAADVVPMKE